MPIIEKIDKAIQEIEGGFQIPEISPEINGQSSPKVKTLLNKIVKISPDCNYLEIGVYRGLTFTSALYQNDFKCAYAIDNWTQFEGERSQFEAAIQFLTEEQRKKIKIIEEDSWKVNLDIFKPNEIDVYFYDGGHEPESQYKAFSYYNPVFSNEFVAMVDDYSEKPIQDATQKAFTDLGYTVLKEWVLEKYSGWWNGLYVAVIRK